MTTTVALANLPGTPVDVAINPFVWATFVLTKDVWSSDQLTHTCTYRYATGDVTTPTTLTASQRTDVKNDVIHTTLRVETTQIVETDDVVTETRPIAVTIGVSAPGVMEDTADVLSLVGSVYALWWKTLTSKVPQVGVIDKMNIGALTGLYS